MQNQFAPPTTISTNDQYDATTLICCGFKLMGVRTLVVTLHGACGRAWYRFVYSSEMWFVSQLFWACTCFQLYCLPLMLIFDLYVNHRAYLPRLYVELRAKASTAFSVRCYPWTRFLQSTLFYDSLPSQACVFVFDRTLNSATVVS